MQPTLFFLSFFAFFQFLVLNLIFVSNTRANLCFDVTERDEAAAVQMLTHTSSKFFFLHARTIFCREKKPSFLVIERSCRTFYLYLF